MSEMFRGCESLEEINFFNFNTNNTTDMSYMYFFCLFFFKKIKSFKF